MLLKHFQASLTQVKESLAHSLFSFRFASYSLARILSPLTCKHLLNSCQFLQLDSVIKIKISGMYSMCSLPVHHAGHTGKHREPSSLSGYRSGLTWVGRAWELGVHGCMSYFHYMASVPGVSAMPPSYKICARGTIWGSYLCIVYNLFSFPWGLFMHNHWLNWIPFWISTCYTVISGTADTRLPWQGSYLKSYLPGNKLVPTPEQIYQTVLVERKKHLVEALVLNIADTILFWSASFTASRDPTDSDKLMELWGNMWDIVTHYPTTCSWRGELRTWGRIENLRERHHCS